MENVSPSAKELKAETVAAWAKVGPAAPEDVEMMDWEWGEEAVEAFLGVRPVDFDINSPGFMAATPLLDLSGPATAAYLGTFLISLLEGFQIQQVAGFPVDIKSRSHTIFVLSSPDFWTRVAPFLSEACLSVVGRWRAS